MAFTDSATNSLFSWVDQTGATRTLDVDVVMNSTDRRTAKLTDHVVETGAVITDHVVIQPEALSLELFVTETPVSTNAQEGFFLESITINNTSMGRKSKDYPLTIPPNRFQPGGYLLLSSGLRSAISSAATALMGAVGLQTPNSRLKGSEFIETKVSTKVAVLKATSPVERVNFAFDQLVEILNDALLITVSFKGRLYENYLLSEVSLESKEGMFGGGYIKVEARALHTVTGTTAVLPSPADFRAQTKAKKGNKSSTTPDPAPCSLPKSILERNGVGDAAGLKPEFDAACGEQNRVDATI